MIKVFADAKMWKLALEIKEDMTTSGVIPNTVTWSSLINVCAIAGLVEQAVKLFEKMLLAGGQPNSQCINIILHACVEACQFDRAFRLFQCWKERGFHQAATDHNQDNAEKFLAVDQMKKSSTPYRHLTVKVPFRPTTSTYNIMMKACGSDYNRAKALMAEMKTMGLSPDNISWSILENVASATQESYSTQSRKDMIKKPITVFLTPVASIEKCQIYRNLFHYVI